VHWRWDAMSAQDLADGGGRNQVSQPAQLTLDADHFPAPVLPRQPQDQRDKLVRDRRPPRCSGLAPSRRGHPTVPAQQGTRGHDPACPQRLRQDPGQRGQQGPVTPGQVRLRSRAAQHRDLVPEREYLRVLTRRTGPATQATTPRSPAAGRPASRTRAMIMAARKSLVKPIAEFSTSTGSIRRGDRRGSGWELERAGVVPLPGRFPAVEVQREVAQLAQDVCGCFCRWFPVRVFRSRS
jgi:hypothetical protein